MSVAGSINSLSNVDVSYITSAEDAVALLSAVQIGVSDELRKFLKGEIEAKSNLSDVIKNYSSIKSDLLSLQSQPISKVSPGAIRNAGTSEAALTQLFNGDGTRLGSNFDDSAAALQTLQDQGVNLSTYVEYPALQENFDAKGNLTSDSVSWFTPELKKLLDEKIANGPSNKYNNATVYYFGEPGKSPQITVFNDHKNIRVDPQSIDSSLVQAKDKYDSYLEALNKSIAKINAATNKLQDTSDELDKVSESQQKMISDLRNSKENISIQAFETRRIERINFLNKIDQNNKSENEISSINSISGDSILDKSKSYKVENPSAILDWKSTETKSMQSLEEQIFQARDNSINSKSPFKAIPDVDIVKII